jgi:hypothetical protein
MENYSIPTLMKHYEYILEMGESVRPPWVW